MTNSERLTQRCYTPLLITNIEFVIFTDSRGVVMGSVLDVGPHFFANGIEEPFHLCPLAFDHGFNSSIRQVLDVTGHLIILGEAIRRITEAHTLHMARKQNAASNLRRNIKITGQCNSSYTKTWPPFRFASRD